MKIPKDVDSLMWEIAECDDARASEDFIQRYPQFRSELIKRSSMVSGLKGARSKPAETHNIPRFTPRHGSPQPAPMRWAPVFACLLLAIVAYASYVVTSGYVARTTKPKYIAVPSKAGLPDRNERITKRLPEPTRNEGVEGNGDTPAVASSLEKPITIKIDRAPLLTVLDVVAAESGLILEVGPNMPNPEIKMEYVQVPGSQIIGDLGKAFNFTALKQSDRRFLIVPATDPQAQKNHGSPLGIAEILDPSELPDESNTSKSN